MFKLGIEVLGGWNLIPLILFSTAFTLIMVGASSHSLPTWRINQNNSKFLSAGICFGFAIVLKHTFLVQLLAAFGIYLLLGSLFYGIAFLARIFYSKSLSYIIVGLTIPLLLLSYWLISNSLVHQFLNNILSSGGKNPHLWPLFSNALDEVASALGNPVALSFTALLLACSARWRDSRQSKIISQIMAIFLLILFSESLFMPRLNPHAKMLVTASLISFALIVLATLRSIDTETYQRKLLEYGICLVIALQICALIAQSKGTKEKILSLGLPDYIFIDMTLILSTAGIAFAIANFMTGQDETRESKFEIYSSLFCFSIVLSSLINLASSGGTTYLIWMIGPFTWLFTRVLADSGFDSRVANLGTFALAIGLFANSISGIANPYAWFNWNEPSLITNARETQIPVLKGMIAANSVANFYENLQKLEIEAGKLSLAANPKILSFGGIPMASAISGLSPYEHNYCKFQWMDLCTQTVLRNDLEAIKKNSPDVIVIEVIPDSIIAGHEAAFLGRPSVIREYYSYTYSQVRLGNWVKVGTIKMRQAPYIHISVYYSTR